MKRRLLACLGGLGVVAAVTLSAPLAASADTYVPPDPCGCSNVPTKVIDVDPSPSNALADTGSAISWPLIGLAGAAVVVGGGSIFISRRHARRSS
ncbi:LPXTG cell wall anchor domain-containing protein [Humibacter sp. RRB41]|uniref:LPXTG cell wall anchor domain-containing protein n=1 Tax=Humibacter sp. RRB41 TaxID=2919946 RepID=UPI001FAA6626|nr:LPXTG cell wall anchor domain-containing protein [Humibacter sp. RRB41]